MALNTNISSELEKEDIAQPGPQRFHVWAQNRDTPQTCTVVDSFLCSLFAVPMQSPPAYPSQAAAEP